MSDGLSRYKKRVAKFLLYALTDGLEEEIFDRQTIINTNRFSEGSNIALHYSFEFGKWYLYESHAKYNDPAGILNNFKNFIDKKNALVRFAGSKYCFLNGIMKDPVLLDEYTIEKYLMKYREL